MALLIQHKRGAKASIPTLSYGELAITTDATITGKDGYQLWIGTNALGNKLIGGVLVHSSKPSFNATLYPAGTLLLINGAATGETEDSLWVSDGTAWRRVGVTDLADLTGTLDDIADGATYGKVLLTELSGGAVTRLVDTGTGSGYVTGTEIADHIGASSGVHGVVGSVVGTSDSQALTNKTLGSGTQLTANLDANSNKIVNLASPSDANDAANKAYVDALSAGLDPKESCRVATTGNITIASPGATIDGATMVAGDRVLVWQQSTATQNGIYVWNGAAVPMTRAGDFDGTPTNEIDGGEYTFIFDGDTYESYGFVVINPENFTGTGDTCLVGTDDIDFTQFSAAQGITAGNGLTQVGNAFNVEADDNSINVTASGISVNVDDSTLETDPATGGAVQVKDGGITETQLNISVAGTGLSGGGGTPLTVEFGGTATGTGTIQNVNSNSDGTPSGGTEDYAARVDHVHILSDIDCGNF